MTIIDLFVTSGLVFFACLGYISARSGLMRLAIPTMRRFGYLSEDLLHNPYLPEKAMELVHFARGTVFNGLFIWFMAIITVPYSLFALIKPRHKKKHRILIRDEKLREQFNETMVLWLVIMASQNPIAGFLFIFSFIISAPLETIHSGTLIKAARIVVNTGEKLFGIQENLVYKAELIKNR